MLDIKFVLNQPVQMEENLRCEFKEVKGGKPVKTIKNTVDEYVVAYLNSRVSGDILWGIRDSDRFVVGVNLNYQERDLLKKDTVSKLTNIQPAISPSTFSIKLFEIFKSPDDQQAIPGTYVVDVSVSEIHTDDFYFTGGNEAFIKTDAGKKKLSGPRLLNELIQRLKQKDKLTIKVTSSEDSETPLLSSALRRAKLVKSMLKGAQILWVDDNPGYNIYERMTLKSMGISAEVALSTDEAMHMLELQGYDAIISDMERDGKSDAGLKLLDTLRANRFDISLIFYVGALDEKRGTPPGAFGITDYSDDLLHLVLDVLERII